MVIASQLWQPFQEFVFMRRALFGGLLLACSTAPLGVFLILRRMSLIGFLVRRFELARSNHGRIGGGLEHGRAVSVDHPAHRFA